MLKRIACIGREARYTRAIIDLDFPTEKAQRAIIIIERDKDVGLLGGYQPDELCYIPMTPTKYQLDFLASRHFSSITIEAAREWLKQHA